MQHQTLPPQRGRHFLDINLFEKATLNAVLSLALRVKDRMRSGNRSIPLASKHLAMIFEKPSTRTRVSFEVGINQLGGKAIILDSAGSQLGRGETIADTARVLSRYVDIIMIRCYSHQSLLDLAAYATVPVINGLTDRSHPCQIMADIMTFMEHRGSIEGKIVTWAGDGNNVARSWVHAAAILGFTLHLACPKEYQLDPQTLMWAKEQGGCIKMFDTVDEAAKGAHLVTTDAWVSMGDVDEEERYHRLAPFQVNQAIMDKAEANALFMHCLPAHRNDEVTDDVMDGPQSVVFDEAENRLHIQKAIMLWCLNNENAYE
ncbi:MAG: ornithine carbamoyltransferase [Alphaproteobacteria bacterium]|nr:ornithine carbamoyltransferase [Alphaproteobacteria bacterium]